MTVHCLGSVECCCPDHHEAMLAVWAPFLLKRAAGNFVSTARKQVGGGVPAPRALGRETRVIPSAEPLTTSLEVGAGGDSPVLDAGNASVDLERTSLPYDTHTDSSQDSGVVGSPPAAPHFIRGR